MIVELGRGDGGLKEYLEHGRKAGRDLHRNELDERIPLIGDLDVFDLVTTSQKGDGEKYNHITLSFAENHVTNEMLQQAADEFIAHALSAWSGEDMDRVALYAEAHRPRTLSYTNSETGEEVNRYVHVHIGIGKHDLKTGKPIDVLGFLGQQTGNLKYIDAWQESFNARHGFSSPKDNPKITPENAIDVLARYSGAKPDELGKFNSKKSAFEVMLQKEIVSQNITTVAGFERLLRAHGEVSKINAGAFNEAFRIKLPGEKRAMRLKGVFFQKQFIERPTSEKIEIISRKAKTAYLEQMQPRKSPDYVAPILEEWHQLKAKTIRYLHTGSPLYKNVYLPADKPTRLEIINKLESEHHGIKSPSTGPIRPIAPARSGVQRMPVRNLDAIQVRTEMLLRGDERMDVRALASGEQIGSVLRQTDGGRTGGRGGAGDDGGERPDNGSALRPGEPIVWAAGDDEQEEGEEAQGGRRVSAGPVAQPSSVLARIKADMRERYEQATDKDRYSEIKKYLDCDQLLASLSHSHGLNPALYQVTTAKDGTPRIQCGSRALTGSDFLTQELGLPWKDAAPILRKTYEHQIGKKATKPRSSNGVPHQLWKEFAATQRAATAKVKAFKAETKAILDRAKAEKIGALAKLSGPLKKSQRSLENSRLAQLKQDRAALLEAIQPLPEAQALRLFLQVRAQAGDTKALAALRSLDSTARTAPAQGITGTIYVGEGDDEQSKRRRARERASSILSVYSVAGNGDVTYHQNGRAVVRDEGQHVAVLDQNSDEAIAAALLLAREKFGTNLTLTGSPEFQRRVVEIAVAQGMPIKFVDPQLETMRLDLVAEKAKGTPVQTQTKPVEAVAPATPPIQQTEPGEAVLPDPIATHNHPPTAEAKPADQLPANPPAPTAEQWIAANTLHQVAAYANADAIVVKYVAPDGIVIGHGKGVVAIYQSPDGTELHAADRVNVRDGALSRAAEPEKGGTEL